MLVRFNSMSILNFFSRWKASLFLAVLKVAFGISHKPHFRQFNLFKMVL